MRKSLSIILAAVVAVVLIAFIVSGHMARKKNQTITEGSVADNGNYQTEAPAVSVLAELTTLLNATISETAPTTAGTTLPAELTDGTLPATVKATTAAPTTTKKSIFKKPETTAATTVPSTAAVRTAGSGRVTDYEYAYAGYQPYYADTSVPWNLLLVNRDYILPEDFADTLKLAYIESYEDNPQKMDYRAAPHYNEMFEAAAKDGIYLYAISGYRSVTRQRNNFERKISYYEDQGYSKVEATQLAARIILPPGTSEHNAGLAVDILSLEQSFENTKAFRWLDAHAQNYGFILRYPKDKQDKTNIIYEPWHYRYVGVETAKALKASGQCYEEYLGLA